MLSQLNHDIKLDNPTEKKTAKKDMLEDLKENNLDKKLLRELKVSIADDASTSGSGGLRSKSNSGDSIVQEQYDINNTETVSDLSDDANQSNKIKAKFVISPVDNTLNTINTINPFDNILTSPITSPLVESNDKSTEELIEKLIGELIEEGFSNEFIENPEDTMNLLEINEHFIT